jgi:antitoxin YefM
VRHDVSLPGRTTLYHRRRTGRPDQTTLPLGEVKSHLSELVGRVHDHHERVTVTVHGRPSAVLVALEDLEQLEETLAILRDADTMRRLASSDAGLARGKSVSADELAEVVRRRCRDAYEP